MSALIRGLPPAGAALNNSRMRQTTHVYGWDEEPADERPSEFMPTTGYSVLSGYHVPSDLNARTARRRSGNGIGFKTVVVACIALLCLSGFAIVEFVKFLRV